MMQAVSYTNCSTTKKWLIYGSLRKNTSQTFSSPQFSSRCRVSYYSRRGLHECGVTADRKRIRKESACISNDMVTQTNTGIKNNSPMVRTMYYPFFE